MNTQRIAVTLLFGGTSDEHDVSVSSSANIWAGMSTERYLVTPVHIRRDGKWCIPREETLPITSQALPLADTMTDALGANEAVTQLQKRGLCDVVFIGLHGAGGEDGVIQGFLEVSGIPYTGSGVAASSLAMQKLVYQDYISANGFRVPRTIGVDVTSSDKIDFWAGRIQSTLGFPCIIKPADGGSSVGVSIVRSTEELEAAFHTAFVGHTMALVQELVVGPELTCGVIEHEDGSTHVLPPTMIRPKSTAFFDYEAKYTAGASEEITPAPLEEEQIAAIQRMAEGIHQLIGCKGLSRTDFILEESTGECVVLETNTLPGMTKTSLVPQEAAAVGISFEELLDRIIQSALRAATA